MKAPRPQESSLKENGMEGAEVHGGSPVKEPFAEAFAKERTKTSTPGTNTIT